MRGGSIYKHKENISSRKLGNDLMLYDQKNDKVHVLNETGTLIWELLDGKNNLQDIENILLNQFPDITPEEILKDIQEIIEKLVSEGLITP